MSSLSERRRGPRLPLVAVPLLTYFGVTVVVPALNGAARHDGFWEHAAITTLLAGAMTAIWLALRSSTARGARRGRAPGSEAQDQVARQTTY